MRAVDEIELTGRQRAILRGVVEEYVASRQPVGSRTLLERVGLNVSPSTVRGELAELERLGLLTHPHTSAGRVPTERGYRYYADRLLEGLDPQPGGFPLDLTTARSEVDSALQATSEMLSAVTRLLALVSAPPLGTATVRHVEVLLLQPQIALVVVITSSGTVTKRAFTFEDPVDAGLADWAASYLNERLAGTDLGALTLQSKLLLPELSNTERECLESIAPVFSDLPETLEDTLYIDGTSRLLSGTNDVSEMNELLRMLERRVTLLSVLRSALREPAVYLRIGAENQAPELHSASIVAANYGLGHRTLGAVSVIGPVRMDYRRAILSVREAAKALSGFVEDVYE